MMKKIKISLLVILSSFLIILGVFILYKWNFSTQVSNIRTLTFCKDSTTLTVSLIESAKLIKKYNYTILNRVLSLELSVVPTYFYNLDKLKADIIIPVDYKDIGYIEICNEIIPIDSVVFCRK